MYAMIIISFGVSLALSAFTRLHPAAYGCLLPVVATVAMIFLMPYWAGGSSTAPVAIPFAFIFVALGSIPGAFAGAGLRQYLLKRKGS